jgi:serine/threonine protein kinase/tetratricopeptide (TPR) repeat protein
MSDGSVATTPDHGKAALARGASIGRYVVLGLVGRGGMGEVYAAYDPELDRKVAVKLLRVKPGAGVSLTEGRQRTLREAQAIARLSHPNVVVVFDVGTFEDKVFIAMEFVEGHTAGFWTQSQQRTWEETLKVYAAAGRGLAAAHEKGLVHRDFKPDNIMVSRDGQVRVMDFGLARQADKVVGVKTVMVEDGGVTSTQNLPVPLPDPRRERPKIVPLDGRTLVLTPEANGGRAADLEQSNSAAFDQRLTRTGAMMGTPAYMAPEQFRGHPTDARTDQFAFCIALYEALYGERPFAGNTLMALTTTVVNGRIREAPATTKVPLWIRKILLRGLSVNADERFPSMEELLEALGKNPAVARRKWAIWSAASAGALVVAWLIARPGFADPKQICAGGPEKLAGVWEVMPPGQESPRQAQLHQAFIGSGKSYAKDVWATTSRALTNYARAWTNMYRENCEATAVRKEQSDDVRDLRTACLTERLGGLHALTDVFSEATGEVVENAVSASNALAPLDRCADVPLLKAVIRPPEDADTRVKVERLRKSLAELKAQFDAGHLREAMKRAPKLVADARSAGYEPLVAEALMLNGNIMIRASDAGAAEAALKDAFLAADSSRHDEVRAEAAAQLVHVVGYQQGRFNEGQHWAKMADAVVRRLGGHELLEAWLLNDLGNVLGLEGEWKAAAYTLRQALALKQKVLGHDHPDVGITEGNLAIALQNLGQNEEAVKEINKSIASLEHGLGKRHPDLAIQISNRGEILNAVGRYQDARESFERAGAILEELGNENLGLSYALTGIGLGYVAEGSPAKALAPLERAFKIREAQEPEPSRRAETAFALARALWDAKRDRARARDLAENAKALYSKVAANSKALEVENWLRQHRG